MIYLNSEDIIKSITLYECMDAIEDAYRMYANNEYNMPDRLQVENNDLTSLYMPCFRKNHLVQKYLQLRLTMQK
ncbi:hypothetical protein Q5M85_15555 [Paraclostridium bifermentans]|nr:hypothetical protein [Paraclostridium bifermentans]